MFSQEAVRALSRRELLKRCSTGFGLMALGALSRASTTEPRLSDHPVRARSVIFCYMSGGVSQVDSFDPKPRLNREHGQPMPMKVERTQFNNNGNIFGSPFAFQRHGQSGIEVSSLFPHTARHVDKLAVIRSMTSSVNEHAQGNFVFHTGFPFMGHASAGAWISYGLGEANRNLPGYVVLQSGGAGVPHGGVSLFGSGYLPARHQGSILVTDEEEPVRNIRPRESDLAQRSKLDLLRGLDAGFLGQHRDEAQIEAAIRNYETAYRMQVEIPDLCDLSGETAATRALYGMDSPFETTAAYGRQCLLARRLVERGVRFVELSCLPQKLGAGQAPNPWDQHGGLETGHGNMARQVDQPIAGLLADLEARGLLDETLVIWAGEFGRTPFSQGSDGRDHNPYGFSIWMAGGGVRGGSILGQTDDYGYHVVEQPRTVYDLWATVLHLMGRDHEQLTFRHAGRDMRLTDVHGDVMHSILQG